MSVFTSKDIAVPILGKMLSDFIEGDIVKLNENGTPVEFYVAKHDYESDLNGTGRTLLVRKDIYDIRRWHSNTSTDKFESCEITTWLNEDYKSFLDPTVQLAMETTEFPYTTYDGTLSTLSKSVFLLSVTEVGKTHTYANVEGTALPTASILLKAKLNGTAKGYWLRSVQNRSSNNDAYAVSSSGSVGSHSMTTPSTYGSRPCFTLPSKAKFDEETLEFVGVPS